MIFIAKMSGKYYSEGEASSLYSLSGVFDYLFTKH